MLKIGEGTIIAGAYKIERRLGRGGMGAVYRGVELATGAKVAVKVLESRPHDAETLERFKREASVSARVDHEGVVKVLASGLDDDLPYFVMELLEGETVAERLARSGPFTVEQTVATLAPVLEVLELAHREGVVHRDLKPANLFLVGGPKPRVKVLDFGISRFTAIDTRITRSGVVMGTLGYMAPEQVADAANVGAAADLYAVGAIAFELLSGKLPLQAPNQLLLMQKIVGEAPPRLSSLVPGVPAALDALIERLLRKAPGERPPGAAAVREALLALVEPSRSPRWPWVAGGLAVAAACGAVALWSAAPAEEPPAAPAQVVRPTLPAEPPAEPPVASVSTGADAGAPAGACRALCRAARAHLPGRPEAALLELNRCILSDEHHAEAYRLSAEALEALGIGEGRRELYRMYLDNAPPEDPFRAEALLRRDTALKPWVAHGSSAVWLGEARRALAEGDFARALRDADACLKQDGEAAGCWFALGEAYAGEGKLEQSARADLIGLAMGPDGYGALDARQRLDRGYQVLLPKAAAGALEVAPPAITGREYAPGVTPLWDLELALKRCADRQQGVNPAAHGEAKVRFRVAAGRAKVLALSPGPGAEMGACVKETFEKLQFSGDSGKRELFASQRY